MFGPWCEQNSGCPSWFLRSLLALLWWAPGVNGTALAPTGVVPSVTVRPFALDGPRFISAGWLFVPPPLWTSCSSLVQRQIYAFVRVKHCHNRRSGLLDFGPLMSVINA